MIIGLESGCGFDESVYVLEKKSSSWVESSGSLVNVGPHFWGHAICRETASRERRRHLVVADKALGCTSNWTRTRVRAQALDARGVGGPVAIEFPASTTSGLPVGLVSVPGGFCYFFETRMSLDPLVLTKLSIYCARVDGSTFVRRAPYAALPEDFVDEWLSLEKDAAQRLVAAHARESVMRARERLLSLAGSGVSTMVSVLSCPRMSASVVEVAPQNADEFASVFFTVTGSPDSFGIADAQPGPPDECFAEPRRTALDRYDGFLRSKGWVGGF